MHTTPVIHGKELVSFFEAFRSSWPSTRMRLRVVQPCDENIDAMRTIDDRTHFCERCSKSVTDIRTAADERAILREARRRGDRWVCIRTAVAAIAVTSCVSTQTQTVTLGPIDQPPPTPSAAMYGGANLAALAKKELHPEIGMAPVPATPFERMAQRVRRAWYRIF